jgi:hypothetical protein
VKSIGLQALYIVGEPGVGKSELVDELTRGLQAEEISEPFAHRILGESTGCVELGKRGVKSGTDSLSSSVIEKVLPWLEEVQPPMLLAEGDKLAVDRFFNKLVELGYDLRIVLLYGPGVAARRRLQRGSTQDQTWVQGRRTKVMKLADRWASRLTVLDATATPGELAKKLWELNVPVAAELMRYAK